MWPQDSCHLQHVSWNDWDEGQHVIASRKRHAVGIAALIVSNHRIQEKPPSLRGGTRYIDDVLRRIMGPALKRQ